MFSILFFAFSLYVFTVTLAFLGYILWYTLCTNATLSVTFSFPSLLSHPRRSSLDSQGLLHTPSSLSHPRPHLLLSPPPRPDPCTLLPTPTPSFLVPFPLFPPTLLNTEPLRSMDLPWISPGTPLRLTDTRLRVFPCFPSLASLGSPSSPHPCFSITLYHLISLLSLIPCTTIDFFSH